MSSDPFNNTEVAFSSKSNKDLNRAYWLFKMISYPWLMKIGKGLTQVGLALRLPIRGAVRATIFRQFCGGETIAECAKTTQLLDRYNIGTILDYSVEGKEDERDLDATAEEILATIRTSNGNPHIPFCVFKVTGIAPNRILTRLSLGEELNDREKARLARVEERIDSICKAAHDSGTPVFIDAEETWIQPAIDHFATKMMERFNKERAIVYNTIQLYRKDRLQFLKASYDAAVQGGYFLGEKLVRGAYMEKERDRAEEKGYPSPIHDTKADTDRSFNEALRFCLQHLDRISFCSGTHNEESSILLKHLMEEKGIDASDTRIYSAQLFGMSDHISFNLANMGYNVAKYVPYGPVREVLPYLIRRAEENTSAQGQTGRELSLILREKARRKQVKK
ncbi:MAG: proline dehydrogenase [Cryomorphaceae bacterium]|nr:MAG: proline dehydrogenase [Cryomorphaceae bacterium]